jgi:hypothetical protein
VFDLSTIARFASELETNGLHRYEHAAPGDGGMSPAQRAVHQSQHKRRLCIGGTQIGKTRLLSAEAWWNASGRHPFRSDAPPPPSLGWIVCADLRAGWPNMSRKMREIEPPGILDPRQKYDDARGYTYMGSKMIRLNCGSTVVGKSGTQELVALSGHTIDWLAFDEVPKMGHFGEARSRVAVTGGPTIMGFSPIGRPVDFLRDHCEGNPQTGTAPRESWDIHRVVLSAENCPHRTPEDIQTQISGYGPWEYRQRVLAEWDGISTERWIPGFTEGCVFGDDDAPKQVQSVGLGWDHGERPGSSVCYLVVKANDRLWVLAEYASLERNTPKTEAIAIRDMMRPWGIGLQKVDDARGDSNSAGRLGLGLSVNETLERAFADLAGSSRPPFPIRVPYKGRGSVKARARMLNAAAIDGRYRVHESCTRLIHSHRHWRGENNDLKHPYDAVSYIADVYLSDGMTADAGRMIVV